MMKVTNRFSVRLVNGHGLGWFDTLAQAEAFALTVDRPTQINPVTLHEMV
jgi:hypothetical protein